jgi:outer membrane receptor for ferrienterochelin and colicins
MMPTPAVPPLAAAIVLTVAAQVACAQSSGTAPAPASAPAAAASAPRPAAAAPSAAQQVQITGSRESDTEQRRNSPAAKIVIGREEIDKFGDANIGEVLRRLPGVTTPGPPGRGGPPRLRGLGNNFTQLLIDGQRVPPGFSLESLSPEQVERIEILRAPTAETGARAIAGTINIITREGFKRRLNDLRIGMGHENGKVSPGMNWSHNDNAGNLNYTLSASAFRPMRESTGSTRTTVNDVATGALLEDRSSNSVTEDQRYGLNLNGRLMWRLGEGGDSLSLQPSVFHSSAKSDGRFALDQALRRPGTPVFYDTATSHTDTRFTNARLGGQWRQRVDNVRYELNGGVGAFRSENDTVRLENLKTLATPLRTLQDTSSARENSVNLTLKATSLVGGTPDKAGTEHTLVGGGEIDAQRRTETRRSLQNGLPLLSDFGDDLKASSLRLAAYVQDEWAITPQWGAYAGLRWEGITTRGDSGSVSGVSRPTNRSSVWTPLFQTVWKPDPKSRDQVRLALTRSYRSPTLANLIARPTINRDFPVSGPNRETSPDSAGNPDLKPELATGIDLAVERYLSGGGVLSVNLFHRQISDLMRGVTTLETVSWSPVPRYVRRMRNIGDATTSGIEMEAKFRLDQIVTGAPGVEMRGNLSLFDSRVSAVPGPNNRLDQQAKATANIGADYRVRGTPFTFGGNANWVPGGTVQLDTDQLATTSTKLQWDGYALWTISPSMGLRLLGSNLGPRDFANTNQNDTLTATGLERTTVRSSGPSYVNWQLRLELKL